jgi:hypothetical protein
VDAAEDATLGEYAARLDAWVLRLGATEAEVVAARLEPMMEAVPVKMVPPPVLGPFWLFKRTPPEESSRLLKPLLREAEVLPEVVERVWTSLAGTPTRALRIGCTHVQVLELVSDEGRATVVAAGVAPKVVLVAAESLVLLALRAGPAKLIKDIH